MNADNIAEYGRALYERHLRANAHVRQITVEQAQAEVSASFAALVEWQRAFEADPRRREAVCERVHRQSATPIN